MATQSLYRRYRPRRFGELRGQEHIVRALRNAVVHEREGQAYLFSGPRGTGKTTSARILAKVLNCERTVDGEPCCECDSCVAVERGTSYDVHELDAASNNGVDAMRDLIEKASLGTPGRHKVYILDEVHMLSKPAEAALLKTLEEPPPHVVFVLATTDPQKVSETIRSRTQHLRFHLLPMDELEAHVRWVVQDAGLEVSEAAIQSVLEQGGGSARDTLSALELVASAGGDGVEAVQYGEFVEALIEHDPGRALTAAAFAVQQGRDPRGLTEDIVRHLRDCFLSLMAPELVALPEQKATTVAEQASRLGAARTVRAMERLGEMLVEMRHAPDPRLLLEVALVQLTHEPAANDVHTLLTRLERLEQAVEHGGFGAGASTSGPPSTAAPGHTSTGAVASAPAASRLDSSTGRAVLGGGARRPDVPARPSPAAPSRVPATASEPTREAPRDAPASTPRSPATPTSDVAPPAAPAAAAAAAAAAANAAAAATTTTTTTTGAAGAAAAAGGRRTDDAPHGAHGAHGAPGVEAERAASIWATEIVPGLKPLTRALFSVPRLLGVRDGALTLAVPNDPHRRRCEQQIAEVEAATEAAVGARVPVRVIVDGSAAFDDNDEHPSMSGPPPPARMAPVVELRPGGAPPADDGVGHEDIDLDDLVDVPPEHVVTPIERLTQAFPGSQLMDERH